MFSISPRNIADRLTTSIRQSLSQPPRRFIQSSKDVVELPGSGSRILWILSRQFLRQKVFDLADGIPEAKRKPALTLLVRKWSPYPSTGFAAHWSGRRANVYAWDAAQATAAISAAGLNPARCAIWPETFMREPLQNGARLAVMADGLEGQVWRDGFLAVTRWWPTPPAIRDWIAFLRSAGVDLTQETGTNPAPVALPILDTPWTVGATPITDFWSLLQNDRAAAIAAAVVAVPFLYLIGEGLVIGTAHGRLAVTMATLSEANKSVRADRADAVNDLDAVNQYLALEPYPSQFEVIAAAARILRDKELSVAEWTYDSGNLELVVQGKNPIDATFFIGAFERDPLFSGVTGSSENQELALRMRMKVTPKAAVES
jgi:hypothetical protein